MTFQLALSDVSAFGPIRCSQTQSKYSSLMYSVGEATTHSPDFEVILPKVGFTLVIAVSERRGSQDGGNKERPRKLVFTSLNKMESPNCWKGKMHHLIIGQPGQQELESHHLVEQDGNPERHEQQSKMVNLVVTMVVHILKAGQNEECG
ncbi:hypothetical protein F444_10809 [Phytophthora nicotianae P1976]|uniref:Uncharacterized protein n=1 Tax=Phytophthora nicotianae P1976 TaxID=1317066 RepID=A0A081A2W5_PHYNI|nr:hypothetical protein F444_10809 [Phytophthora nicotianae P1976]